MRWSPFALLPFLFLAAAGLGGAEQGQAACGTLPEEPSHGPIQIRHDLDLAVPDATGLGNGVRSGSGTRGDPYVIANWAISQQERAAIDIRATAMHLVIRDLVVLGSGSQTWPAIIVADGKNILIERIHVLGPTPAGAIAVGNSSSIAIRSVDVRPAGDDTALGLALAIGGMVGSIDGLTICGDADLVHSGPGSGRPSEIRLSNLSTTNQQGAKLVIVGGSLVTLNEVHAPVDVSLNLLDGARIRATSSAISSFSASMMDAGGAAHLELVDVHIACPGECAARSAFVADLGEGRASLRRLGIEGYDTMLTTSSGSLLIEDSLFRQPLPNPSMSGSEPAIRLIAACRAECGSFTFSRNDFAIAADASSAPVMKFETDGPILRGTQNYLAGVRLEGRIELTDPAGAPNWLEPTDRASPAPVVLLAIVLMMAGVGAARGFRSRSL